MPSLRLEQFRSQLVTEWAPLIAEELEAGDVIRKLIAAGHDGDLCRHIVLVETEDGKELEIVTGYPEQDADGADFGYPSHVDELPDCEPLVELAEAAGSSLEDETWTNICEAFELVLDYETRSALEEIRAALASEGVAFSKAAVLGLQNHDEEHLATLEQRERDLREFLSDAGEELTEQLANLFYLESKKRSWLAGLSK